MRLGGPHGFARDHGSQDPRPFNNEPFFFAFFLFFFFFSFVCFFLKNRKRKILKEMVCLVARMVGSKHQLQPQLSLEQQQQQ